LVVIMNDVSHSLFLFPVDASIFSRLISRYLERIAHGAEPMQGDGRTLAGARGLDWGEDRMWKG
jgi:hypothetical protein